MQRDLKLVPAPSSPAPKPMRVTGVFTPQEARELEGRPGSSTHEKEPAMQPNSAGRLSVRDASAIKVALATAVASCATHEGNCFKPQEMASKLVEAFALLDAATASAASPPATP